MRQTQKSNISLLNILRTNKLQVTHVRTTQVRVKHMNILAHARTRGNANYLNMGMKIQDAQKLPTGVAGRANNDTLLPRHDQNAYIRLA